MSRAILVMMLVPASGCWVTEFEVEQALSMGMLTIRAGTFEMGSEDGATWEQPAHQVTLTHDYAVGWTEITQAQWSTMGPWSSYQDCPWCPATGLSWHDAAEFTNALSTAARLEPCYVEDAVGYQPVTDILGCTGYRLPVEAEWERAARADQNTRYSGSDDPSMVAWTIENSGDEMHDVCGLARNAWGLCDMSGNALEWVNDWYGASEYDDSVESDPTGPSTGSERVLRGGSKAHEADDATVYSRNWSEPTEEFSNVGFRVARTIH